MPDTSDLSLSVHFLGVPEFLIEELMTFFHRFGPKKSGLFQSIPAYRDTIVCGGHGG